jgi:hypothetical protein
MQHPLLDLHAIADDQATVLARQETEAAPAASWVEDYAASGAPKDGGGSNSPAE